MNWPTLPRVLVTGTSRYQYADRGLVEQRLTEQFDLIGPFVLLHGAAPGVDSHADSWGHAHYSVGIRVDPFPVHNRHWRFGGLRAAYDRNSRLVHEGQMASLLRGVGVSALAFPAPGPPENSPGTWDCIRKCTAAGILVAVCQAGEPVRHIHPTSMPEMI